MHFLFPTPSKKPASSPVSQPYGFIVYNMLPFEATKKCERQYNDDNASPTIYIFTYMYITIKQRIFLPLLYWSGTSFLVLFPPLLCSKMSVA